MINPFKGWFKKREPELLQSFALKGQVFDQAVTKIDDPNWDISIRVRREFWRIVRKHHPEIKDQANRVFVHGSEIYIVTVPNDIDSDNIYSMLADGKREFYV